MKRQKLLKEIPGEVPRHADINELVAKAIIKFFSI